MHSFDNSANMAKKTNNWSILSQFFIKNELPFNKPDYEKIIIDNDFPLLVDFISKIYSFLTQKKITKPPLATYLQTNKDFYSTVTQTDKNLGTSFILKDKGLEKLDDKKNLSQIDQQKTEEREKDNKINETCKIFKKIKQEKNRCRAKHYQSS